MSSKSFESIGITVSPLSSSMKEKFDVGNGVLITSVKRFSEGFDRGLSDGLIIIEADKEKIESVEDLSSIISKKNQGDVVIFKVKNAQGIVRLVAVEIK